MKSEHIEKLLNSLGCEKIKIAGNKVRSTCPLAPWKHGGGKDEHPSLAVFISADDTSGANCMSGRCGFHGSLSDLIYKLQRLSGRDMSAQLLFLVENNAANLTKRMARMDARAGHYAMPDTSNESAMVLGGKAYTEYQDYADPLLRASMSAALPASATEMMVKMQGWLNDEALVYLQGPDRRFSIETIRKWKIGWHPAARRISLPQYDHAGRLVNLSGRHVPYWPADLPPSEWESKAPKWMHSLGFNRELFLFGEDHFELSGDGKGRVFIVEGGFDVVYLNQCGLKNVAGINGSHINKTQVDKLLKWFDSAVLLMDGDQAGIDAAGRIEQTLAQRMHVVNVRIPNQRDPNQMELSEIEELKYKFMD